MSSLNQIPAADTPHKSGNLFVVEALAKWAADRSSGQVTIESANPNFPIAHDELASTEARNLALRYAATCGMGSPCINGNVVGPYAINSEGRPLEDVKQPNGDPYPVAHPLAQPAGYRLDVLVCRKF